MMYVAFYKGRTRAFDRAVQWWESGPYSHCELVLADTGNGAHLCASSSMMDGGVRVKEIALAPERWDLLPVPWANADKALDWLDLHDGCGYDYLGLAGFVWRPYHGEAARYWCSEAVAAMLGLDDPWRYGVNGLAGALLLTTQHATAPPAPMK